MNIAILKYNAGNIKSVQYALERIGVQNVVTDDPAILHAADKVIFPGVGEASSAMKYLRSQGLDQVLLSLQQPVLGICLGMQLMCKHSEENNTECLGVFDVQVKKFAPPDKAHKVPQMGWNTIYDLRSPLFEGISEQSFVYYVHGYYADLSPFTIATTEYIQPYSAALNRDNFYGVQFHPEKSATVGERILKNFIENI